MPTGHRNFESEFDTDLDRSIVGITKHSDPAKQALARQANEDFTNLVAEMQNEQLRFQVETREMRGMRGMYAKMATKFSRWALWYWAIAFAISAGWNVLHGKEPWSDHALTAMTAGVTINVLGTFIGVVKGLFGTNSKETRQASDP